MSPGARQPRPGADGRPDLGCVARLCQQRADLTVDVDDTLDPSVVAGLAYAVFDRRSLPAPTSNASQPPGRSSCGDSLISRWRMRTPSGPPSNARLGSWPAISGWHLGHPPARDVGRVARQEIDPTQRAAVDERRQQVTRPRSVTRSSRAQERHVPARELDRLGRKVRCEHDGARFGERQCARPGCPSRCRRRQR